MEWMVACGSVSAPRMELIFILIAACRQWLRRSWIVSIIAWIWLLHSFHCMDEWKQIKWMQAAALARRVWNWFSYWLRLAGNGCAAQQLISWQAAAMCRAAANHSINYLFSQSNPISAAFQFNSLIECLQSWISLNGWNGLVAGSWLWI